MIPLSVRPRLAAVGAAALVGVTVFACSASRAVAPIEPRYVAVHNTLAAMGLVQVGPIQQGTLAEGREARVTFDLPSECATLVAVGGDGVRDIDVTLSDAEGKALAHDTTREAQAAVRACVDSPGTYTLTVKMAAGAGPFVAAAWSGSAGPSGVTTGAAAASAAAPTAGQGTCEAPFPLTAGTLEGNSSRGEGHHEGTCGKSDSKEIVYRLELRERQHVSLDVRPRYDAVLYVRKGDCAESTAEVACNDDAPNQDRSKLDLVLDPGTYFVFVDGYGSESGAYRMTTTLTEIPPIADVCRRARVLTPGAQISAQTSGGFDNANASCGDGAKGIDSPFKLDVPTRSRVRVTQHSSAFKPVVHLRRACGDEQSEIGCSDDGLGTEEGTFASVLDPGSYTVWADARERDGSTGRYSLVADFAPEHGAGVAGDACGDAQPILPTEHEIRGDTFLARDDVAGRCGGAGAADVLYRVDLPRRSRLSARLVDQEGRHVLVLQRACGDRSSEIACGARIDEALPAGTYWLAVDGAGATDLGKFILDVRWRELGSQDAACRSAPLLVAGQTVQSTTTGQGDKFSTSCGGREDAQSCPDRMYKIELRQRARVRLLLTSPTWDAVLTLRRSCVDTSTTARAAEVSCVNDTDDVHHARIEQTLEAGTYYVLVDGHATGNEGPFSLEYKILP